MRRTAEAHYASISERNGARDGLDIYSFATQLKALKPRALREAIGRQWLSKSNVLAVKNSVPGL